MARDPYDHWNLLAGSVDSHCHLQVMKSRGLDIARIVRATDEAGMRLMDISIDLEDLPQRLDLADGFPNVSLTAGFHPSATPTVCRNATSLNDSMLALREALTLPAIVAVGEIGLDYHWNYGTTNDQSALLDSQLQMAADTGLPVIIHNREADTAVLSHLKNHPHLSCVVMHCFSSDRQFCERCLDLGYMISFAGNLTYKKSQDIREAAAIVPDDRLLAETDSPFLAPQPVRGTLNSPAYVGYVYEHLALLRNQELSELVSIVRQNFETLVLSREMHAPGRSTP